MALERVTPTLKVFVGWDPREPEAYEVCSFSLRRRCSIPVQVHPIKLDELRQRGLYWRAPDPLASTEFTYSRFLTPALAGYQGLAVYCDSDFLWLADIAELIEKVEPGKAVQCVKHDYTPRETSKMDGRIQTRYPRKNWSSLMVFECSHPSLRALDTKAVNEQPGAWLHRMQWVEDHEIGALPPVWNWLEGWSEKPPKGTPKAVHFTRGGPWFEGHQHVAYAAEWHLEYDAFLHSG